MRHYKDLDFISSLDGEDLIEFIKKAFERDKMQAEERMDELLYNRWSYQLPFMGEPISFNEFRDLVLGKKLNKNNSKNQQTNEQLIEEIERIKKIDQELNGAKGGHYK